MAQAAESDGADGRNYNTMRLRATGLDPAHPGEGTQGRVEMWLFLDGREGVCRELPGGRSTSRAFPLTGLVRREACRGGGGRRTGRDSSIWSPRENSPRLENILSFVICILTLFRTQNPAGNVTGRAHGHPKPEQTRRQHSPST